MASVPEPTALSGTDVWIFDLDNTLYSAESNLFPQVSRRMGQFIAQRLALSPEEARALQSRYFREHGTTLRGLMTVDGIDPHEFLDFVHDIDLGVIDEDPRLAAALAALPGRRIIYTNGSTGHAMRVLGRLGIAGLFEHIEDIVAAGFVPKPNDGPYRRLVERMAIDPARAVMVEDIAVNLVPARAMGMVTAWVRTDDAPTGAPEVGDVDFIVEDLAGWLEGIARARAA